MLQQLHAYIMMSLWQSQQDKVEHSALGHMHAEMTRYRMHIVVSTVATALVQSAPSAAG